MTNERIPRTALGLGTGVGSQSPLIFQTGYECSHAKRTETPPQPTERILEFPNQLGFGLGESSLQPTVHEPKTVKTKRMNRTNGKYWHS